VKGTGRRVLVIGIAYYEYTTRIVSELRARGDSVTYAPIEKPSLLWRTCKRFAPARYVRMLDRYHRRLLARLQGEHFDQVLFVQVHQFSDSNLAALRASQQDARFILYNWDSIKTHDYTARLRYFDSAFTFDEADAKRLGINLQPLFALPEYFVPAPKLQQDFDVYFVGALGTVARVEAIRKFDAFCVARGLRFVKHAQCSPAMLLVFLRKGLYFKGMTLRSLSTAQIVRLMHRATAVFDFPNHQQAGFTMRVIENMCAGKKIITSSSGVRDANFFDPTQFHVVRDLDFSGVEEFLRQPLAQRVPPLEFSIGEWVNRVVG
jgi:hypothetical protein